MTDRIDVKAPGGFAPAVALGHADADGRWQPVSAENPLPVAGLAGRGATPVAALPPPPLTGTAASPRVIGPFDPLSGRPVFLQLSGTWTGEVQVLRSVDGGATRQPLTVAGAAWAVFTGNVCEPVWEESEAGATLYLALAPGSGTIAYRVSQ